MLIVKKTKTELEKEEIKKIEKTIQKYRYEQINFLGQTAFYKDSKRKQGYFSQAYNHTQLPTTGTCSELMNTTAFLNNKIKQGYIYRAVGEEPQYFFSTPTNKRTHCFCIYSTEPLIKNDTYTKNEDELNEIINQNPLIIDGSFNIIEKIKNTDYKLKLVMGEYAQMPMDNEIIIDNIPKHESMAKKHPLIIENDYLFSLCVRDDPSQPFLIDARRQYDTKGKIMTLSDAMRDETSKLGQYAKAISKIPIRESAKEEWNLNRFYVNKQFYRTKR